jgi:hypothetical protein
MPFISESSFQKSGPRCSKEDFLQILTQRSQIPRFCPDGPVMRPDTHQCLEDSNNLRLHPSGCHGNTFECSLEFDKKSDFLHRHRYGKKTASVQTTGQHHLDAILDKARRGEELQPSGRQSNTVRTLEQHCPDVVLIMVITCSISAIVRMLGQHRPDTALIWNRLERVMESWLHNCPSERP